MFCSGCGKAIPEGFGPACPFCGAMTSQPGPAVHPPAGIPWEKRSELGFFPALFSTLRGCLFDPDRFFSDMPKRENVGSALLYMVILGWIGGLGGIAWSLAFPESQQRLMHALGMSWGDLSGAMRLMILCVGMVFAPIILLVSAFIAAGIFHVSLWILGGAQEGFEATLRSYCYARGSTALFEWVPLCGGIIGLVWYLVLQIYGIARGHSISGGKAAFAVFLPVVLCCMVVLVLVITFASFFAALMKGASG